jgi:hypothetical protein
VNRAQGKGGSGGRIDALRNLVRNTQSVVGVNVDGAWLVGVDVRGADLEYARFKGANLQGAPSTDQEAPPESSYLTQFRAM